jgi:hypothetical protein
MWDAVLVGVSLLAIAVYPPAKIFKLPHKPGTNSPEPVYAKSVT